MNKIFKKLLIFSSIKMNLHSTRLDMNIENTNYYSCESVTNNKILEENINENLINNQELEENNINNQQPEEDNCRKKCKKITISLTVSFIFGVLLALLVKTLIICINNPNSVCYSLSLSLM